jgi:hypothetical protein
MQTRLLGLLLCLIVLSSITAGQSMKERRSARAGEHLTADATIQDLLNHPAFAGFGRLLLPWDDRTYDNSMRLRNIASLLPYHTHVDPHTVVNGLNHMIDDVSQGTRVFYDFYSPDEKKQEPARSSTGLFFFRGKAGAPFAIISPGGGFSYVGSVHEGFPYAVAISKQGYNAFVLKYRRIRRRRRYARSRGGDLLCIPECHRARCGNSRLFPVGEFGWRTNGCRNRIARRREIWWRRISQTVNRCDGVHRALRVRRQRAADFRRGWRA